jgi:hypothetical protein
LNFLGEPVMQVVTANGAQVPSLGFENEADVGRGFAMSGMPRADVFLTTKVWAPNCSPRLMRSSVDESLRRLAATTSTCCCCIGRMPTCRWRIRSAH